MGMLDQPKLFSEHFKEGEVFTLTAARVGPEISTDYGVSAPALLKIGDDWYSIFGKALINQVERLERGELPHKVAIVRQQTRSGQPVKVIVPEEKLGDEDIPF
jgi:hypothetical protein